MTLSDVAQWLDLSWDTVKTVVQQRLENDYRKIGYRHLRHIAIDETYLGRTRKRDEDKVVVRHHSNEKGAEIAESVLRKLIPDEITLKRVKALNFAGM